MHPGTDPATAPVGHPRPLQTPTDNRTHMTQTRQAVTSALASAGLAAGALLAAPAFAQDLSSIPAGTYAVDPTHAYIDFSYNHLGLSNPTLSFDDFDATLELDPEDPTQSTVSVTIDPASVVAGSDIWKEHLTGPDFFDVAENPEITFESTSVSGGGDGAYKVDGDLTIKGETRPVTLNVTINAAMNHPMSGDPVVGLDASGTLLRSDFGMGKFAPNVSDEVALDITAEMVKTK